MKDPNIIRIGDEVKIINPNFFIRCGYPLSLKDEIKEINKHYGKATRDLMNQIVDGKKAIEEPEKTEYECPPHSCQYEFFKYLAYFRLMAKKFGGNERTLHTEYHQEFKDKITTVTFIKFVKTGIREPGFSSRSFYDGYECEPPCLSNQKTHKILELNIPVQEKTNEWTLFCSDSIKINGEEVSSLFIEACNVEKI